MPPIPVSSVIDRNRIDSTRPWVSVNSQLPGTSDNVTTTNMAAMRAVNALVPVATSRMRGGGRSDGAGGSTAARGSLTVAGWWNVRRATRNTARTTKGNAGRTPDDRTVPDGRYP